MENRYLSNKIVIKYCPDYYRIINEEFNDLDYMSDKIIQIYQKYIFSVDTSKMSTLNKLTVFNDAIAKYFDDREFKKIITNILVSFKVPKNCENVINEIVKVILKEYNKYLDGYTRNLYIPRWL